MRAHTSSYISIYYYMSCSVSRPVSCPDVPVSPRVRRTRADIGTRGMIQGVIQNKTCNNLFITYIQQNAVSYMQLGTHKDKIRWDQLYVYSSVTGRFCTHTTTNLHQSLLSSLLWSYVVKTKLKIKQTIKLLLTYIQVKGKTKSMFGSYGINIVNKK